MRLFCATFLVISVTTGAVQAEAELSLYGLSTSPSDSNVQGSDPGGAGTFDISTGWSAPAAAGVRLTWWQQNDIGFGLDVNTAGVLADPADLAGTGITDLALENGTSIVTLNAYRRWNEAAFGLTPYVGAGVGLSVPQVIFDGGGVTTSQRQLTGPAMQVVAGARYSIGDNMSLFGEMQGAYSVNVGELQSGGTLDTSILSNGLNFGISLGF